MKRWAVFAAIVLISTNSIAQAVDNTASFHMINAARYVRLHYENDFFTGHDLYYTQGINLEIVNPKLRNFFVSKVLVKTADTTARFGISLEHNGYTPASIRHDDILYGDRPFAADLFLKLFSFSANATHRYRVTSSLSLGVIGSAASGYWMQKTIHHWLNGTVPHGWQNQIANDIILNYETGIEKNLWHAGNIALVNAQASARAGTLSDKATAGFVLMTGRLTQAITNVFAHASAAHPEKFTFHLYVQPLVNVVGYDATLQGGIFNKNSPYVLSLNHVKHITGQINYGLVINYRAIVLEYFKSAISREFSGAANHQWGGLRLGVRI